jgi:hypothetical protein
VRLGHLFVQTQMANLTALPRTTKLASQEDQLVTVKAHLFMISAQLPFCKK